MDASREGPATPDGMSAMAKAMLRAKIALFGDWLALRTLARGDAWGLWAMIDNGFDPKAWRLRMEAAQEARRDRARESLAGCPMAAFAMMLRAGAFVEGDFERRLETLRARRSMLAEIQGMLAAGLSWRGSGLEVLLMSFPHEPEAAEALWAAGLMDSLRAASLDKALAELARWLEPFEKGESEPCRRRLPDALAASQAMVRIEAAILADMATATAPSAPARSRL